MIQKGEVLGGMYRIICEIGHGGTGIIYLAEHIRLRKKVVVKKIKDHFTGQINGRAEVDILKNLHHTCLPQVYDFLEINGSIYTVMEYIKGYDLQYYLDQNYRFPEHLLRQWLLQLSEVLEYLHSQNPPIYHSDIKPSNLMITEDKSICLIDFNISLDGENTKDVQGVSQWYAAPEQYEKAKEILCKQHSNIVLDGRMDIYSLGATFYRVMTGNLPSLEHHVQTIMEMDIPYCDGMKAVISKAMQRKPGARFQTAGKMNKILADVVKVDPVYRRCVRLQITGIFTWMLLVIAGVLIIYYGSWQNGVEKWNEAYRRLYISAEMRNETEIVAQATEILNDFTYKGYMERNIEQKAEVLHVLGDSYFRKENFREAATCYQEAWELMPEVGVYCRDYVIALVRSSQSSQAYQVMESVREMEDLTEADQSLIQAEIAWLGKDKETALEEVKHITEEAGVLDSETLQRGYLLAAAIYEEGEEYALAVEMLDKANESVFSWDVLRQMGQLAVKAASVESRSVLRNSYLQKALECYETLNQRKSPTYNDCLNRALVERGLGDYEGSNRHLQEMLIEYPEDYRISMWMCYNYLDIAAGKRSYEGIMDDLKFRYKDCRHLYDALQIQDSDMEELIGMMDELEE